MLINIHKCMILTRAKIRNQEGWLKDKNLGGREGGKVERRH